jgi:hypothetical protein
MTKKRITFDTVRKIGLALPDVEEGTSYGSPALKVRGKMFTCVPNHRSAEADSLAIRLDFAQRDELIAAEPGIYYLPDHYVNYPVVLVRLSCLHENTLRDLLAMSRSFMAGGKRRPLRRKAGRAR